MYTIYSLDQALAVIGGYAGIIWQIINFLIGGYQDFKFEMSLMRSLYTRDKKRRKENQIEEDHEMEIKAQILNRKPHHFTFVERLNTKLISTFCCCFYPLKCYKDRHKREVAHDQARDRLA